MKKKMIAAGVLFLIAAGTGPASADKCNGAKVKAIGKKESGLLGCSGKEATKGTAAVQPACNQKVSGKFVLKYNKPTGCVPSAPSDSTCETTADSCQSAIRAALPDGDDVNPNKCEAARLKAAGKLASGELGCISKAAAKSLPVDPACITKATGKFTAAFNKVSGCTGDGNAAGIQSQIEASCVDPVADVSGGNFVSIVCGGGATTTTTVTSTTTTTSTTFPGPCCGMAPTKLVFTTGIGSGNCGTVLLSNGTVSKNLACSGLYTGGGGNTVPLPYAIPDQEMFVTGATSCNNGTGDLTLTNLTSAQTGSNRNCTSVGCFFGAPLPIPNATTPVTSVCVINIVATDGSGSANCLTGDVHLGLPLDSELYLDGDLFPNAPGIQVCPVCNQTCNAGSNLNGPCNGDADCPGGGAGSCAGASKCHGGPNDGNACTPADSATLGTTNSFPTSLDCPPPPANSIGGLPIAFDLVTGTKTLTAQNLGNGQANVFCGYCRDVSATGTLCFAGDPTAGCPTPTPASPIACTSNAGCPAAFPDCQERTGGAFGPAGLGAHTINETGAPAGDMTDGAAHGSTLASIFCIPPTFNATVDAAGDLPGPGAVTLSGAAQLVP